MSLSSTHDRHPTPGVAIGIALGCAFIPLIAGVVVFLLWLEIRLHHLESIGLLVIVVGLILFVAGLFALVAFLGHPEHRATGMRLRSTVAAVLCLSLMLANFPIAFLIVRQVLRIESKYAVLIHNQYIAPAEHVRIVGGGRNEYVGSIAPGQHLNLDLRFDQDGPLEIKAEIDGVTKTHVFDNAMSATISHAAYITIHEDGAITGAPRSG